MYFVYLQSYVVHNSPVKDRLRMDAARLICTCTENLMSAFVMYLGTCEIRRQALDVTLIFFISIKIFVAYLASAEESITIERTYPRFYFFRDK